MNDGFPVFQKMPFADCCGCEACANACPKQIIHFKEDGEGFRFPYINNEDCIHCNACIRACPQLKEPSRKIEIRECYAGYSQDSEIVEASSSGGYFTHIVEWFKKENPQGKFAGVVWADDFRHTEFVLLDNIDDLKNIRVAKYIQARKNGIYRQVKKELLSGTPILFSGCPCEVAALVSCIGKIPDNLFLVDFVCKGSTSEKVMREYLDIVAKNKKIESLNLRVVGGASWIPQWMKMTFVNGKTIFKSFYSTILGHAFHLLQRDACYKCKHCGENRFSDLTLGDFHGADRNRQYYNARGTSIMTVNTTKGKRVLNYLKDVCVVEMVSYEEISKPNPRIEHAWNKDPRRDAFGKILSEKGLFVAFLKTSSRRHALKLLFKRLFHLPI
jgi:coenzyme F420-reducing hydrogenase beta subunit